MDPEPKPWLDIPDPLAGAQLPANRAPAAPSAPSPTRADLKKRRLGGFAGGLVWAGAALAWFGLREELAENAGLVAGQAIAWVLLVLSALMLALGGGRRGLGSPVGRARALAIGAPVAFLAASLFWLPKTAEPFGATGDFTNLAACFAVGMAVAVPLLALALWSVRRSFPSAAGWRGALLGAASGLGAALVLTLHCASPLGGHIALAHGLPLLLSSLAAAWLATRFARA
jgi:hypothetical protein